MKRLQDSLPQQDNKRVKNQENVFPDDVCYEVMKFLSTSYLVRKCFLISKQWYNVAINRCKFSIVINDKEIFSQFLRSFMTDLEPFYPVFKLISFPYYKNIEKLTLDLLFYQGYTSNIGKSLPNLTSLKMQKDGFRQVYMAELEKFPSLKEMSICGSVSYSNVFSGLESISVLDFDDLHNLVRNAKNLTSFDCKSYLGGKQIKVLGELKQLKKLGLSCKAKNLSLIVDTFPGLTSLSLFECELEDAELEVLSDLKHLKSLNVSMHDIGNEGAIALSSLTQLTSLDVAECRIEYEGLQSICKSLTQLRELSVEGNTIRDEGALLICSSLKKLHKLLISNSGIGDEGCKCIANSLVDLEELSLDCNPIGDEGMMAIFRNLVKLKRLSLGDNHASYSTMQLFISQMPTGLNITVLDP